MRISFTVCAGCRSRERPRGTSKRRRGAQRQQLPALQRQVAEGGEAQRGAEDGDAHVHARSRKFQPPAHQPLMRHIRPPYAAPCTCARTCRRRRRARPADAALLRRQHCCVAACEAARPARAPRRLLRAARAFARPRPLRHRHGQLWQRGRARREREAQERVRTARPSSGFRGVGTLGHPRRRARPLRACRPCRQPAARR
jgi:hypothetical protein